MIETQAREKRIDPMNPRLASFWKFDYTLLVMGGSIVAGLEAISNHIRPRMTCGNESGPFIHSATSSQLLFSSTTSMSARGACLACR